MSACTKFLSHPIDQPKPFLIEHLIAVGKKSKELFAETSFRNQKIAYYSGLLHDIGKMNPWYQEIFNAVQDRKKIQEEVSTKFVQQHSVFSTWAAKYLLSKTGLDDIIDKILILINGHHTTIRRSLGEIKQGSQFKASQEIMNESIRDFSSQVIDIAEFSELNWSSCVERFPRPILFDLELNSMMAPDDYLEMSVAFSCLLQADRGSFDDWSVPKFSLSIDTTSLTKSRQTSNLQPLAKIQQEKMASLRNRFQKEVMENYDYSEKIIVIHAPTGIGKTKVFLDLIAKYKEDKTIQRVFYFSPLLALTEDFERKFESTISEKQAGDVLIYNHMFAESLEEKKRGTNEGHIREWNFLIESFNKPFVITTTQRLLMTIYSNTAKDKMKMASFRNSILIIDEVQTIPK
ncbi:MAG: CRISPR-associated endonuclease Cas3'', partial [Nitrosopumilus sp.]|nr:CRISPR-associated endonuclease Cas3'' [Nitrosopumilus sp.]